MKKFTLLFAGMAFCISNALFAQETPQVKLVVKKTTTAPVIDGNPADEVWSATGVVSETLKYFVKCTGDDCTPSAANLSGSFKALYDDNNFYLLVSITDDVLVPLPTYTYVGAFNYDAIEVLLSTHGLIENRTINNTDAAAEGLMQFRFNYGVSDPSPFTSISGYNGFTHFERNTTTKVFENRRGIEAAFAAATGGFTMEIKIPFETIFFNSAEAVSRVLPGKLFAFEVHYSDNDEAGTATVKRKITWNNNTGEEYWNNPTGWTLIQLEGGETAVSKNSSVGVTIFPNPVGDVLKVDALSEVSSYEIYNVAGALVKREAVNRSSFEISTSVLDKGVYFLQLNTTDNRKLVSRLIKK